MEKRTKRESFRWVWGVILLIVFMDFAIVTLAYQMELTNAKQVAELSPTHIDRLFITKGATVVGNGDLPSVSVDYKTFVTKAQHGETIVFLTDLGGRAWCDVCCDAYCSNNGFTFHYRRMFQGPTSFKSDCSYHYDPATGYITVQWKRWSVHYPVLRSHIYFAICAAVIIFFGVGFIVCANPFKLFRYPPQGIVLK